MKFSYFPGCTDHSTSYEYVRSANAVLVPLGVEVVEVDDWNCCGAAATHSLNHLLSLCLPARNISKAQSAQAGPLFIPCAGCFNMLKRAEHALQNDAGKRKEIEEIVGFKYETGFEILALSDMVINRIGLEKVQEKVRKPLKGLKTACYYGCALVRHPNVTRLDDPENPQYIRRQRSPRGGLWNGQTSDLLPIAGHTRGSMTRPPVCPVNRKTRRTRAFPMGTPPSGGPVGRLRSPYR